MGPPEHTPHRAHAKLFDASSRPCCRFSSDKRLTLTLSCLLACVLKSLLSVQAALSWPPMAVNQGRPHSVMASQNDTQILLMALRGHVSLQLLSFFFFLSIDIIILLLLLVPPLLCPPCPSPPLPSLPRYGAKATKGMKRPSKVKAPHRQSERGLNSLLW